MSHSIARPELTPGLAFGGRVWDSAITMVQLASSTDSLARIDGARVAIIQGAWHRDLSDVMVRRCSEVLVAQGAADIAVHVLPGSLELPLAAQRLARRDRSLEAIIAFGIIVKGDTDHYEVVRDLSIGGLGEVMLREDVPVIIEVLPVLHIDQARARCADNEFNKGIEAAGAAIGCIDWRRRHPLKAA